MPKLNANVSMLFTEIPFLDRFEAAAQAGFRGVEFLFPYDYDKEELAEKVNKFNLKTVLFNMPAGNLKNGDRGLACNPNRVSEFQENVSIALEYAKTLDCKQIHCMAGIKPSSFSDEKIFETYVENLRFAAHHLKKNNICLLIEPINIRDIPGYLLNYSADAIKILNTERIPNLKLQYDIYHMQIMEGDLSETIKANLSKIGHMQLADTPGRNEPGTGEINFEFLLKFIDSLGYTGWIGCEYKPLLNSSNSLKWATPYLGKI